AAEARLRERATDARPERPLDHGLELPDARLRPAALPDELAARAVDAQLEALAALADVADDERRELVLLRRARERVLGIARRVRRGHLEPVVLEHDRDGAVDTAGVSPGHVHAHPALRRMSRSVPGEHQEPGEHD